MITFPNLVKSAGVFFTTSPVTQIPEVLVNMLSINEHLESVEAIGRESRQAPMSIMII